MDGVDLPAAMDEMDDGQDGLRDGVTSSAAHRPWLSMGSQVQWFRTVDGRRYSSSGISMDMMSSSSRRCQPQDSQKRCPAALSRKTKM
jgi:hypothetical protein